MSCKENKCQAAIEFYCLSCDDQILLCHEHGKAHHNAIGHMVRFLNDQLLKDISKKHLMLEIDKCISKVISNLNIVISDLKKISAQEINKLKKINRIEDLNGFNFDIEGLLSVLFRQTFTNRGLKCKDEFLQRLSEQYFIIPSLDSSRQDINFEEDKQIFERKASLSDETSRSSIQMTEGLKGYCNLDFNQSKLESKKKYIKTNWNFINVGPWTHQLLLSNDYRYVFHCN